MPTLLVPPIQHRSEAEQSGLLLTDENAYSVELADWAAHAGNPGQDWVTRRLLSYAHPFGCPCLVLLAGARVVFPTINVGEGYKCLVTFGAGLPEVSRDGLAISIDFREEGGAAATQLFHERILSLDAENPRLERTLDLAPLAGRRGQIVIACDPGPEGDSRGDWLAVYEFVLAPAEELPLRRARAFAAFRERNELAVFSTTYDHAMYNGGSRRGGLRSRIRGMASMTRRTIRGAVSGIRLRFERSSSGCASKEKSAQNGSSVVTNSRPKQNLGEYYTSRLIQRLGLKNVDFRGYLARKLAAHSDRTIRILSLASGAARIEEGFVDGFDPDRIELTLTDINPDLLARAKARLAGKAQVRSEVMNLNRLQLPSRHYDIIVCVSALHHVVELERVIGQSAAALVEDGEFWSVGEYVGRNGTRLYDDALAAANEYFRQLPDKYRVNRNPGSNVKLDERLPNLDCSLTCFEGIRSAEIEPIMDRCFSPVEVIRYDCFLWRLFNLAYFDNYNLDDPRDREIVDRAVELEIEFVRRGGRPTALWGVYRAR
jgi:SAM-dependent methyltransferase